MTRQSRMSVILFLSLCAVASSNGDPKKEEAAKPEDKTSLHKRNAQTGYPDQITAETGHLHGAGAGGDHSRGAKYFMYAHQPDKKQYEFGYKRGSGKHSIERYEKAGPNHNFKTKVRWQDEKGGHGEHYWDYNHSPKHEHHDDGHGKGGHGHGDGYSTGGHGYGHHFSGYGHGGGHHSEPVPEYVEAESQKETVTSIVDENEPGDSVLSTEILKRSGLEKKSTSNEEDATDVPSAFPHILGFNPYVPPAIAMNRSKSQLNKLERQSGAPEGNTEDKSQKSLKPDPKDDPNVPKLAYDIDTGRVYEENTNSWFNLVPVKS